MNLLITGAWKYTAEQKNILRKRGYTVIDMPDERGALPCDPAEVEAVICNGLFLYHPIEAFTALKKIQLTSAGLDRVPVSYVEEHDISIHSARGVYSVPMAEFALSAVLRFYKRTDFFAANQKEHRWDKHRGLRELAGKTVCIVGCGSVGTECAKRFAAMGCEVIGVDAFPREDEAYTAMLPTPALRTALLRADVTVLTLPLTDETRGIMGRDELAAMPNGGVLVNIARGGVLDTDALINETKTGRLCAALDVFDDEPLSPDSPLWDIPTVTVTPHNSFVGEGNAARMWKVIEKNLLSDYF
jgi:phosphoglycerate dehydrogenase-like enzyme